MIRNEILETKWGNAKLNNGYYQITSSKEGNAGKMLHRLIFEDFYKIKLPRHIHIHHEDGNRANNEIWNLIPMTHAEHIILHHKGKIVSEEIRKRMGEAHKGLKRPTSVKLKMSRSRTSTGFFRVFKHFTKNTLQGFRWAYVYIDEETGKRKSISSIDIRKLEQKVKSKGLDWYIVDEEKAKQVMEG